MDLSRYPWLRDEFQRGLVKELHWVVPRGERLLRLGSEADAMRWLGVNPAIPARRRGEAVRRAMRDALRCGRSLPLELFNPSMQLVATFKDGSEVKFVPDGTVPNSEVH